jgi:HSP20 family protein
MALSLISETGRPWWMTPGGEEPVGDVFSDRLWPEWQRDIGEEETPEEDLSEKWFG